MQKSIHFFFLLLFVNLNSPIEFEEENKFEKKLGKNSKKKNINNNERNQFVFESTCRLCFLNFME